MSGTDDRPPAGRRRAFSRAVVAAGAALLAAGLLVLLVVALGPASSPGGSQPRLSALQTNPDLDPGTSLHGRAPDFTLVDQFGRPVSLRSYRGRVVLLAFNDSQCTTICPLTTAAMLAAKRMLGPAADSVQLLGVNANPTATAVRWVRAYSQVHGMLHQWEFLTGSPSELRAVWSAYHIAVQIESGQIDHTPALYVINQAGDLTKIYLTTMAYSSVEQQAQVYAHEISSLLPTHPPVRSALSYATVSTIGPASKVSVPRAGGGTLRLGPDGAPRLYVFFATWLTETIDLSHDLESLRGYQSATKAQRLPALTAVDEGSIEPSPDALSGFLRNLPTPLPYPVAIDPTGRVADGYEVQDQPWFVLVSPGGSILWYWDGSTQGWPSQAALIQHVRAALSKPRPVRLPTAAQAPIVLAGSPPPLAALHKQASRLLGSERALTVRLEALRGYPIVLDAWASWCTACVAEYHLFAAASIRYGRQVAFVGVDTLDTSPNNARSFLATHPLSYPSYQSPNGTLPDVDGIQGLPTTILISRAGRVVQTIPGQFDSQGELDGDIQTYLAP
jgi:cytochrome oxidase Cu insertion factor (SCO1/SenC/PrrC family)/thiol-disulfide isomerase/thioredoxin